MMKKSLLLTALVTFAASSAFAEFPEMQVARPITYTGTLTSASQLTSVTVQKTSWSDKQALQLVENGAKAYILNLESDEEIYATDAQVITSLTGIDVEYTFPAPTENGEYQVVIPAGTIETVEGHETNPEISRVYTLADPSLEYAQLTPVTLTPAPGTAINGVNTTTGPWTVAFDPEIQKNAGYMKVSIKDADPNHLYEGEPFYSQIQLNRREVLGTGEILNMDLSQPFNFTWGGKEGSGLMYQGYEYTCRFEVRESEYNEAKDGPGQVLGVYECTYKGNTMPEQYSDAKLITVSPTPMNFDPQNPTGYVFEDTNDPHVTFFFDKAVEPNYSLCAVNTGSGTSVPFEGTAVSTNEGKEWRFTIPKSQIQPPSILMYFAFKDAESGLPVKGNNGRGANSNFSYEWQVETGLPTLSVVIPDASEQLGELSSITVSNSGNYYFVEGNGTSVQATLSTKQGGVVYTFDYSKIVYDNDSETKTATLIVDPAITDAGSYVLTIPKAYFMLAPTREVEQYGESYSNKALTCSFNVVGEEDPETLNAVFKASNPENNTEVTTLRTAEIFFDIPDGTYAAENYLFEGEKPVLKNASGDTAATIDVEFGNYDNSLKVNFNPEITEPGTYTITFPDKFFKQDESNNYTPEFTLSWTIKGGAPSELAYDLEITASPENNANLTSIQNISLEFPMACTTKDNSMFKATLMKDTEEVATFFMAMEWHGEECKGALTKEITDFGKYTMTVPQGEFISEDKLHANPEITFTWNITENGVEMIRFVDGIAGDVYTIDGTLVVAKATAEDIENLAAGIYVIGGNKYVVK